MKKNIFKIAVAAFLIIPAILLATGCSGCDSSSTDNKLVNYTNSSLNVSGDSESVTFQEREFKNIGTAINYASKALKDYSFKSSATGTFSAGAIDEQIIFNRAYSITANKKYSELMFFRNSNTGIDGSFLFQYDKDINAYIYAQTQNLNKAAKKAYYDDGYYVYDLETEKEYFILDNIYEPGETAIVVDSSSVGSTVTNMAKTETGYYCKVNLNENSAKKYVSFVNIFAGYYDCSIKFSSCTAEIYFDKYSHYSKIIYDIKIVVDARALPVIGTILTGNIKFTETYSSYGTLNDVVYPL